MTEKNHYKTLEDLATGMQGCKRCPLHEGRTNIVFGSGDKNANVMIVGEAPGKNEDETGEPFVGKAGRNLNELLQIAGLARSDVYIANVIKCRPPANRDPKAEEVNNCSEFLRAQTAIIKPKVIITLGNFATKFILKTEVGITKLHGKPVQLGNITVFTSYHPAACIYDPAKREAINADFAALKKLLAAVIK